MEEAGGAGQPEARSQPERGPALRLARAPAGSSPPAGPLRLAPRNVLWFKRQGYSLYLIT
jgi:hypothetical protein